MKNYKYSESFNDLFTKGNYNCVSGTALYASVLKQLGYSPKIFETRYHIFLLVWLDNSARILFEATDPINGFVDDDIKISNCIKEYLYREQETINQQLTLSAPFNDKLILNIVSQKQLAGLQYYNLAVQLINKENYFDAFRMLKKATLLYPTSLRIKECIWFCKIRYEMQLSNALSITK